MNELQVIIDWLQFTITKPDINYFKTIIHILELNVNDFITLKHGKLGYKTQLFNSNISVLYDGAPNMGVHVIISGQGCRYYESQNDLIKLVERINKNEGQVTRIDIAIDDMTGKYIQFGRIKNDIIKGNLVSKWKESTEYIRRLNKTAAVVGHTVELGSRSSQIYFRMYDKALQQKMPDIIWNRIELEIKKKYAQQVQRLLSSKNVGQLASQILNNYLRIVQPSKTDTNKSRWQTKKYWTNLIQTTEKQKLTVQAEEKTIDDTKAWIIKQVAPSLSLIMINDHGNIDFIQNQIIAGQTRLKEKHFKRLTNKGATKRYE